MFISSNKAILSTSLLALLGLLGLGSWLYLYINSAEHDATQLGYASDLRVYAQQISNASQQSVDGNAAAFSNLDKSLARVDQTLQVIDQHNSTYLLDESELLAQDYQLLSHKWGIVKENTQSILGKRDRILFLHDTAKTLEQIIPEIQSEVDKLARDLVNSGATASKVAVAQKQSLIAERIIRSVEVILGQEKVADNATKNYEKLLGEFRNNLTLLGRIDADANMHSNAETKKTISKIERRFSYLTNSVRDFNTAVKELAEAKVAKQQLNNDVPSFVEGTNAFADAVRNLENTRAVNNQVGLALLGFTILMLAIIGSQLYHKTVIRLSEQRNANSKNQEAIQRLLREIGDLADGDLTAKATVTEDFTGAIADAINYTIEQLRGIVQSINGTTMKVSAAARDTQVKAMALADASEKQAGVISGTSSEMRDMAGHINQMSSEAKTSASVAAKSVDIAKTGSEVVKNTMEGMDTIREQIQVTSKRLKRLGESSQEIGDIISLITDIADQTNILALNASIQASMAGEAGRGFAVVADEVQRLAEKSSSATKQIEGLVRAIQNDTSEAVSSMEQTTSEVVKGASLAHDAGNALEQIEQVSLSMADMVEKISASASVHANQASEISSQMAGVQTTTTDTAKGTVEAAARIGTLSKMTIQLRDSVAGFTLDSSTKHQAR